MTNRNLRLAALIAVGAAVFSAAGCNKLKARDQLNKGVASYKNARYEQAIDHFQNAVNLDPGLENARLYLATAYTQMYIPEVDTPDNVRMAEQAIDQFKAVLQHDPKNVTSVKGIAYLYLQEKKFDDAKTYYHKALEIDPNDPEAYYTLGVIAWTQSYKPRMDARAKLGLKPDEPLKDKKVCQGLRDANWGVIQQGLDDLNKALQLRPDYDDAMAYVNLLYREKADLECGDPAARAADEKTADEWVDKTMATKKRKVEKQPSAPGITMNPTEK
ncbi:MAG: tetratricopeptide repeat protein [Terriglobales bacterium]